MVYIRKIIYFMQINFFLDWPYTGFIRINLTHFTPLQYQISHKQNLNYYSLQTIVSEESLYARFIKIN